MREDLTPIAALFGLEMTRTREDLFIPGSPERCIWRAVIEDSKLRTWVIERIGGSQKNRRERIGSILHRLGAKGLEFVPAYRAVGNSFVAEAAGALWQASPYVAHLPLPRPHYVQDTWRGQAIGTMLARLHAAATADKTIMTALRSAAQQDGLPTMPDYIEELMDTVSRRHPEVHARLKPIYSFLKPSLEAWHELEPAPAHGDTHPLNILWGPDEIAGLIDWEFVSMRPRLYDAANCIGCVGIEDPQALGNGLVPELLQSARTNELLTQDSGRCLFELMLAIRFAWLSEWLRKKDREMIELELDYMELLLEHARDIKKLWGV